MDSLRRLSVFLWILPFLVLQCQAQNSIHGFNWKFSNVRYEDRLDSRNCHLLIVRHSPSLRTSRSVRRVLSRFNH
ncbi:hypothetical protein OH77DRAFT_1422525 [Trametes cingulata]|nr:hypothetical protein OH77DRAFT_1422525 [Trametes cingulata]